MAGPVLVATMLGKSWCRKVVCRWGKGRSCIRHEKYEGEIFTDYYFGEANTAIKSENHHINAINENLNWGGISGLLQLLTAHPGSVHGGGEAPGGQSSLRQGARIGSPGSPDL